MVRRKAGERDTWRVCKPERSDEPLLPQPPTPNICAWMGIDDQGYGIGSDLLL
jgi:hypothetical protein